MLAVIKLFKKIKLVTFDVGSQVDEKLPTAPCDNFYKFSCQLWNEQNPRPEGIENWDVVTALNKKSSQLVFGTFQYA